MVLRKVSDQIYPKVSEFRYRKCQNQDKLDKTPVTGNGHGGFDV